MEANSAEKREIWNKTGIFALNNGSHRMEKYRGKKKNAAKADVII